MPRRGRSFVRPGTAAIVCAAAVTVLASIGLGSGAFSGFQRQTLDRLFPTGSADPRIVVVGIDSAAERQEGHPWPWPREDQASLIEALQQQGASLILYDILLSSAAPGDDRLAQVLRAGHVVLPAVATFDLTGSGRLYRAEAVAGPTPELASAVLAIGASNLLPDPSDGVVRAIPLAVEAPDRGIIPSVVLELDAMARAAKTVPTIRPEGVQVGQELIPTESRAALRVSFAPGLGQPVAAAHYVSASDLLTGRSNPSLRGAIVLVGVVDPTLGDVHVTPIGTVPGVVVLANAVNTVLTREFVSAPPKAVTLVWVGLLALAVALLAQLAPPWLAAVGGVALAGGYLLVAFLRFDSGHAMDLVYPELATAIAFVGSLGDRTVAEARRRRRVASLFAQYVPPSVARRLVEEPALVESAVRGERFDASLLFCDLRGFTALAGSITPQQVRDMLEVFYDHTSRIVLEHQGTIIQYVGDEIYAAFGVPAPIPEHAARAVACGVAFQRVAPAINERLAEIGIRAIRYGVGIESGEVVAALVGSEARRQYGVNGDAVNVAARLCAAAPAGEVWITSDVLRQLDPPPQVDDLGVRPFKNVAREVHVFRLEWQ